VSRFILSAGAEADLNQIWEFIAQDSLEAADRWIEKLFESFELLSRSPGIGHMRGDLTSHPVLFWPVGAYLVIYRAGPDLVEIVAVTHGARDIPSFLLLRGDA
jgi:plasmid stabilization system protein ParE